LILLFDKVQLFFDGGVVLVLVPSDLEQYLDHVLRSLLQICGLVEDRSELVEYGHGNGRVEFFKMLATFSAQADCNLNAVVRRLMEKEKEDLGNQHLVHHLLVA